MDNRVLTEDQIAKIRSGCHYFSWDHLSYFYRLPEDFIREFRDQVNWSLICEYQDLSEDFIREFRHVVYWAYISRYQNLSEEFLWEFQDRIDFDYLSMNPYTSSEVRRMIKNGDFDRQSRNLSMLVEENNLIHKRIDIK